MTWTGVVWREAGIYGAGGSFVQQVRLGRYTLSVGPEVGGTLEIDGEYDWVVSVAGGFCHVREWRPIRWRAGALGTA
jgi:hypothetical protein